MFVCDIHQYSSVAYMLVENFRVHLLVAGPFIIFHVDVPVTCMP